MTVRWVDTKDELCRLAVPPADAEIIRVLLKKRLDQ